MAERSPQRGGGAGASAASAAGRITVDQFTEAVFSGVLRAIDARREKFPGKIIYGIIYDREFGNIGPIVGPGGGQ